MPNQPLVLDGPDGLAARVGTELGVSDWMTIEQSLIDSFAADTGDHYWIHTDPPRAERESPFGTTIAHGLLTLSLGPKFSYEIYSIEGFSGVVNYGYGKVRFPTPVPVGSRMRMRAVLTGAEPVGGGTQITVTQTYELEGAEKPACVAEALARLFAA
jgi:acyl dehydratase